MIDHFKITLNLIQSIIQANIHQSHNSTTLYDLM